MLIVAVVISGHLLPWSMGRPLERFGLGLPSPMAANPELHAFLEQVHDTAGRLFVRWLALHAVGAVKHAVFDRRGVALRMIRSIRGGRRRTGNCRKRDQRFRQLQFLNTRANGSSRTAASTVFSADTATHQDGSHCGTIGAKRKMDHDPVRRNARANQRGAGTWSPTTSGSESRQELWPSCSSPSRYRATPESSANRVRSGPNWIDGPG